MSLHWNDSLRMFTTLEHIWPIFWKILKLSNDKLELGIGCKCVSLEYWRKSGLNSTQNLGDHRGSYTAYTDTYIWALGDFNIIRVAIYLTVDPIWM